MRSVLAATNYQISPLEKEHNRNAFSCGEDSLDNYFQQQAGQDSRKRVSAIYVLRDLELEKIAGFYTLSATNIELTNLPEPLQKKLPSYPRIPATLLGRLAIDKTYQKNSLGEILLIDALKRSYKASIGVASFAVVVDAINENAKNFYKKYGFSDLHRNTNLNQLFIPMGSIKQL